MDTLPAIFLSHGAPNLPLKADSTTTFLRELSHLLPKPKAILCISAHWATRQPVFGTTLEPHTIHDFSGFPTELYQLTYPAPGAPEVARRGMELLAAAGIESGANPKRGLDHGAWVPLLLAYPQADVPVAQLSIQPHSGPKHHYAIGRALAPLRREGVLILASGGVTHNLGEFRGYAYDAAAPDWVNQFADWLTEAVTAGNVEALLNYRALAPHATRNHPTEEHLLPLFVALGAGGMREKGVLLHSSFTYGILSMAAYGFGEGLDIRGAIASSTSSRRPR
jgi:4,5-DOPA dioxygenase extradiol